MRGFSLLTVTITILIVLIVQLTITASAASVQPAPQTAAIQLTPVPMDDPELVNPGRGYYTWRGKEIVPLPEPAHDDYERYYWYDPDHPEESIEPAQGVYNFALLDRAIAVAHSRGEKFAFRIRTMANKRSGQRYVPDYLKDCGWEYRGTFIPDWNAPCFLDNAEKMMQALGQRYNGDPRLAWIDISLYGEWGEWALGESIYSAAPPGIEKPSEASLARIIDMQIQAFPDVRKVMFAKTRSDAVIYALTRSDQIGWRVDCLGRSGYFNFSTDRNYQPAWKYMQDRWKTAPVIVEFCAGNIDLTSQLTLKQVQDFHISLIGNGNIADWKKLTPQQQDNLILIGKTAGYRYLIRQATFPTVWTPSAAVNVVTEWENAGVAPHYEPVEVRFQVYDPRRQRTVWETASRLDLQSLLPTVDGPVTAEDKLMVPDDLPAGLYELRLIVVDPQGYRRPLKLAISGRQADGSYLLGNITVKIPAVPRRR